MIIFSRIKRRKTNIFILLFFFFHLQFLFSSKRSQYILYFCADNDHVFVLSFSVISNVTQMMTDSLFHFGRFGSALTSVYFNWTSSSVHVNLFIMICMEIIYRHVKLNLWFHRCMSGWYTSWVPFLVRWVTELRSTKLRHRLIKNGVWVILR